MLLGNCTVAEKIAASFPRAAVLRRHPPPPPSSFAPLLAAARAVGLELRTENGKAVADSLDTAVVPGAPHLNRLLRILTTRCMMQATYFPAGTLTPPEFFHYGLASPI
jgi:exosome complex exonuclease DIS3/RRP44